MSAPQREETPAEALQGEEPSPLLGRWSNVYRVVILELAVTVALLYALTRWAS